MPQATCFVLDLDDTLYPERDYVRSGFRAVDGIIAARLGIQGFGESCWQEFVRGQRGSIFNEVLESHVGIHDLDLVAELVHAYRTHHPLIELHTDARRFLERAGTFGLPLALITDGPRECQRAKIEALDIQGAFAPLVVTAELGEGKSKPHHAAFELVEQSIRGIENFVYIADNPLKDFLAPNRLGWATMRIQRPGGLYSQATAPTPSHAPHHAISSLDEVLGMLQTVKPHR